jgi:catechol 2,3-dioxygenase-like lactoylglutathione lyase family enzyme
VIRRVLAAIATVGVMAGAALAADLPPLTPETRPIRASGVGLTVVDLERSKAFYTEVLGFKVGARVPAQGPAKEYLLGLTGDIRADTLVVLTQGKPAAGATSFGRVILVAPSGRVLAERAAAAGFPPAKIVDGTNFIRDPDGYTIELYQRPTAAR